MKSVHQLRDLIASKLKAPDAGLDWRALSATFLKLGATGFGGGIAIIAQIRRLVVRERRWLSEVEFLDAVSLAQSLPGANAVNAITYVGLRLGGIRGAIVSVVSFVLPSFLMMIGLTIAHDYLHHLPDAQRIFQGFNAAVVGLIAAITVRLGKTAVRHQWHLELGVAAGFVLIFTDTTVVEVVLLAGMIGVFVQSFKVRVRHRVRQRLRKQRQMGARTAVAEQQARQHAAEVMAHPESLTADCEIEVSLAPAEGDEEPTPSTDEEPSSLQTVPRAEPQTAAPQSEKLPGSSKQLLSLAVPLLVLPFLSKLVTIWQLVMIFLRVGAVTFGGGFVMIPQIEVDVVDVHRWLTHQAFADGMAFGQLTPGPVMITATFIGYKVAGIAGAIAATVAAFLPSFLMTVIAGTSLNRFRTNHQVQAFLSGVAPAVVGMLAAAGVSLARSALMAQSGSTRTLTFAVATLAFLLMLRAKLNPVIIMFCCGLLQLIVSRGLLSV
jgi:chromate transporter